MDFIFRVSISSQSESVDMALIFTVVSHKYTLLTPNETAFVPDMSTNDNRMEVRKNWDMLMPRKIYPLQD